MACAAPPDRSPRQPFASKVRGGRPPGGSSLEFEQAYDDSVSRVYAFFAYRLNSSQDAEDLTQQTFERALRAWDRFDPRRAPVGSWLLTIAHNLLVDHYRARAPRTSDVALDALEPSELPPTNGTRPSIGLEPELARALARLPQRDREVVALRYGGELTGPEIVELTGLTLANVQQILSRSLRRLRATLED